MYKFYPQRIKLTLFFLSHMVSKIPIVTPPPVNVLDPFGIEANDIKKNKNHKLETSYTNVTLAHVNPQDQGLTTNISHKHNIQFYPISHYHSCLISTLEYIIRHTFTPKHSRRRCWTLCWEPLNTTNYEVLQEIS